jgi:hypothetical protein
MAEEGMSYCQKCHKTMKDLNFYTYRDGTKTEMCKQCMTMHIDNFNPETFLWLLEKMDVPYIEGEWNTLRNKAYSKDPYKMNGMSVFGKYLAKMKLKQWKDYRWADTERLQKETEEQRIRGREEQLKREERLKEDLENGLLSEAEYKTLMSAESLQKDAPMFAPAPNTTFANNPFDESNFMKEEELVDPASELTQEDKLYLAMKWGRLYKASEWVELERHYNEMMNSFDIQDADSKSTLILLCKTDLKMNQAIDSGDLDGYQKLARVSDSLRKSAKFTAAQNKEQKSDYVDSVGELVAICEKEGFIPRFCTDIPQDKVDKTLKDMNNYLYKLVTQDLGFGQQIEDSLKKIQLQKEMNDAEIALDEDENEYELRDLDMEEFYEEINDQIEKDKQTMKGED